MVHVERKKSFENKVQYLPTYSFIFVRFNYVEIPTDVFIGIQLTIILIYIFIYFFFIRTNNNK